MDDKDILAIYIAQSENVRHLDRVIDGVSKDINLEIRKSNNFQVTVKTKILALLYSAWSESQFVQISFTEHGFMYSEICKILDHKKKHGIAMGWRLMIEIALGKVSGTARSTDLSNRMTALLKLIREYIEEPSVIRNKIAHGQWINALNSTSSAINNEATRVLSTLDPVEILKRVEIHRFLGYIVRDLVQSPKNGFHKFYWSNITSLENYIARTKHWSLRTKALKLSKKPIKH